MNLIILGDSQSGSIVLCHEEHYISTKKTENTGIKQKQTTKYLVNLIPRVLLVPSLSEDTGPLLDYTLINSPAPNILVRLTQY